ncbi:MAG: AAA family ATPase [Nanoarchaeota archaeon]|nr:AAA family ATPase [Nanoarchaeota archaeon]
MTEQLVSSKGEIKRMPLSIKGLDDNIGGGLPTGSIMLVCGPAGTMKSSLCFNSIYAEAEAKKNVLYITLEQSYVSLLNQMINMGYDFQKIDVTVIGSDPNIIKKKVKDIKASKKGHLILSDLGSLRATMKAQDAPSADWWNIISRIVKTLKEEVDISCVVLDSLNSLYVLSDFKNPRNKIFHIFNFFKQLGITAFFVSEMPKDSSKYCEYEIEDYLADGVLVIQLVERNRKVTREVNIAKMRGTDINIDIFTLEFGKDGFKALYGGKMPLV